MKGIYLNKLHRYVGITLAPFIVIQTMSGLLLKFGLFRRGGAGIGGVEAVPAAGVFDPFLVKAHFGPGIVNDIYHILMALAIVWMAVTGWMLFLRIRRAQRRSSRPADAGGGK